MYHGVVAGALGWACWKTYVGRPETHRARRVAIGVLGVGLTESRQHEDALSVKEAELSMERRLGASEDQILAVQANLANTYQALKRHEEAALMHREVYSGRLKLFGEEHEETLIAANNYAVTLLELRRFGEAKALLRKTMPVAQRVLGESCLLMLKMSWIYAAMLRDDEGATIDDLREAVTTLEETARSARRVLGGAHPLTVDIEDGIPISRAALAAREGGDVSAVRAGLDAMKAT
jgi:hypothetical protein